MAQRAGPGGRAGGQRFAQFKLVLLGAFPDCVTKAHADNEQESQPLARCDTVPGSTVSG